MQGRKVSGLAICLMALPAFVVAQQVPPVQPVVPGTIVADVVMEPSVVVAPVSPLETVLPPPIIVTPPSPPTPISATPPATKTIQADVQLDMSGTGGPVSGGRLSPLPKVDIPLPAGMTEPTSRASSLLVPSLVTRPTPAAAPAKLTSAQIAQQIAPNFNVTRDYVRLTQCYGIADFMGAVTRIQASRPGATPQVIGVARSIGALQEGMQPMVLAASTVRTEARFRRDYDAIARRGQQELATSRTPNVTMQRRLASLDACRGDVVRWRGGR